MSRERRARSVPGVRPLALNVSQHNVALQVPENAPGWDTASDLERSTKLGDGGPVSCEASFAPISPLPTALPTAHEEKFGDAAHILAPRVPRRIVKRTPRRTLHRMYAGTPTQDVLLLLIPAVVLGVLSGGLPVAMTHIIGRAFAAFAAYDPHVPTAQAALYANVRTDVYVLLGLAAGTLVLRSAASALWLLLGERCVRTWRTRLFRTLLAKDISWYDLGMGLGDKGDVGAAGLMALFLKDTDELRTAMGLQMGHLVVHIAAASASFVYAMYRHWSLTLVIFASIPVLAGVTIAGDVLGVPLQTKERAQSVQLAALVETCTAAIRTVKAFNAQDMQASLLRSCILQCRTLYTRMCCVWGARYGICAALSLLTFVQGFGYGSHLVRSNLTGADVVLATFLASLVAMGQLQSILMRLSWIEKGKNAAVSLDTLMHSVPESDAQRTDAEDEKHYKTRADIEAPHTMHHTLSACSGEMALEHVWMAYPTRPTVPALQGVSMYFAAGEHTYVVGRSGSGKSTVAQLLLQLHEPQAGVVTLDTANVQTLDKAWFRAQVAGVAQEPLVLERTLYENISIGVKGDVRAAVCAARLDDVLTLLPEGLDTLLGRRGTDLSGGQKQRVALARALLRDPPVLILDEVVSALDAACAAHVHAAVRAWRQGRTTIIITHNVAHIQPTDFCYVMDSGRVVEEGFLGRLIEQKGWLSRVYFDHLAQDMPVSMSGESLASEGLASLDSAKVHLGKLDGPVRHVSARHIVQRSPEKAEEAAKTNLLFATARTMLETVPHRTCLAAALVVCIASGLTVPAFAYCLTQVMMVIARSSHAALGPLVGATAAVAVADGVLKGTRLASMEALTARWVASLRMRAMDKVLVQDARWYDQGTNAPSALATIVGKDAEDAGACLGQMLGQLIALAALILGTLLWALVQGWQLTFCALAMLPLVGTLYAVQGRMASKTELVSKVQRERLAHLFFDQVSAVRAVRAMALEDALCADAEHAIDAASAAGRSAALAAAAGAGLAEATTYASEALLYGVGAVLLANHTYDLHKFMMVLNPVIFAVGFSAQLAASMPAGSKCMHALASIARLVRLGSAASDAHGDATPTLGGRITFSDVCFSYQGTNVLDHLSFTIEPGERVALVGPSGAGKSTVAALLQRLYEPDKGAVYVDQYWARTLLPSWLRSHMAVVSQMPTLFPATVRANLELGTKASEAECEAALQRAGAAFVHALPGGLDASLGKDATHLSGGQAQRIAIARALIRTQAKVLLLDEFTAALDPATRAAVVPEVLAHPASPTVLLVTHDVSLMRQCDRILVLSCGRLVEHGAPDELLKDSTSVLSQLLAAF